MCVQVLGLPVMPAMRGKSTTINATAIRAVLELVRNSRGCSRADLRGKIRVVFVIVIPLDGGMVAEKARPPHLTVLPLPVINTCSLD